VFVGVECEYPVTIQTERPTVAVASTSFSANRTLIAELAAIGVEVVRNVDGRRLDAEEALAEFIGSAEYAVVGQEPVGEEVIAACPNLEIVAKYGVGLDNVDEAALVAGGVKLGWTGGVNRRSVTELTLAFALGHLRNVWPSVSLMRKGQWDKVGGRELSGCRFGIVGLGHIGADVARIVRAFGATVAYRDIVDRSVIAEELGLRSMEYEELLREANVVSFHVPATPLTKEMFGATEIALMKPGSLVINTARGRVIRFAETVDAVRAGRLGGFAADVFPSEPFDASAFAGDDRLYFTPHIGGNSCEAIMAMGRSAIRHLRRHIKEGR
jgi:D-3-phosphoglycerate dehydrogenase